MKIGFQNKNIKNGICGDINADCCFKIMPHELAEICGGRYVTYPASADAEAPVFGICTDSREAADGIVFAALRGERTDGHRYIKNATEQGCRCFLCEYIPDENTPEIYNGCSFIQVPDTVKALAALAGYFRDKHSVDAKTVGITGSVGKTTTKELVSCVLSERFKTHKTAGNFNSDIGMPLVIMECPDDAEVSIVEMGMGNVGDISRLSGIAKPDVAIITTIGTSHIEALGSRENICKAKLEITDGLKSGGTLVLNGDEPLLDCYNNTDLRILRVSCDQNKECDISAENIRSYYDHTEFEISDRTDRGAPKHLDNLKINLPGKHNVYAALFAYAVASSVFGMSGDEIRCGIEKFRNTGYRQNIKEINGVGIVEDCYNASPESMKASLTTLSEMGKASGRRTVAVLGDMLELGAYSAECHRAVGQIIAEIVPEYICLFGNEVRFIAEGAIKSGYPEGRIFMFSADEDGVKKCAEIIADNTSVGDIILFKASRGMRAERISAAVCTLLEAKNRTGV